MILAHCVQRLPLSPPPILTTSIFHIETDVVAVRTSVFVMRNGAPDIIDFTDANFSFNNFFVSLSPGNSLLNDSDVHLLALYICVEFGLSLISLYGFWKRDRPIGQNMRDKKTTVYFMRSDIPNYIDGPRDNSQLKG